MVIIIIVITIIITIIRVIIIVIVIVIIITIIITQIAQFLQRSNRSRTPASYPTTPMLTASMAPGGVFRVVVRHDKRAIWLCRAIKEVHRV